MQYKKLSGGNLKQAGYDANEQILEIHFQDGTVKRFKAVQSEVFNRFIASPNPATYYQDRIEEEYPIEKGRVTTSDSAKTKLDDLFG